MLTIASQSHGYGYGYGWAETKWRRRRRGQLGHLISQPAGTRHGKPASRPAYLTYCLLLRTLILRCLNLFGNRSIIMAASICGSSEGKQTRRRPSTEGGLRRRCLVMVKQQRTRFYILRRCVSMLLCWQEISWEERT